MCHYIALLLHCNLTYTYQWETINEKVGANSPEVWVDKVGEYRCTLSNGTTQCFSEVIHVSFFDGKLLRDLSVWYMYIRVP